MNPALVSSVLLAATMSACAADRRPPSVGGTWSGHVKLATCPQCETWMSLDLSETSTGNVTGVLINGTSGSIDFSSGAAYVVGTRAQDSISLVATIPCDSLWRGSRLRLTFRGKVSSRGDTVSGEFVQRFSRDAVRIPMTLSRALIDSSIREEFTRLRTECGAAA